MLLLVFCYEHGVVIGVAIGVVCIAMFLVFVLRVSFGFVVCVFIGGVIGVGWCRCCS